MDGGDVSSGESASDVEFADEGEQLEDDEELRLHCMGSQTFYSTWFP